MTFGLFFSESGRGISGSADVGEPRFYQRGVDVFGAKKNKASNCWCLMVLIGVGTATRESVVLILVSVVAACFNQRGASGNFVLFTHSLFFGHSFCGVIGVFGHWWVIGLVIGKPLEGTTELGVLLAGFLVAKRKPCLDLLSSLRRA